MRTALTIAIVTVVALGARNVAGAQEKDHTASAATTVTLQGYVVDAMCGKAFAKKSDPMSKAARHTRACALAEACAAEGYGIFADGRWLLFDQKGNSLVHAALEKDTRSTQLYYAVRGSVTEGRFMLEALEVQQAPEKPASGGKSSMP